jgi:poly(hydroxyalkanoate) depolymerase family esterase
LGAAIAARHVSCTSLPPEVSMRLSLAALILTVARLAHAASLQPVTSFGDNPGALGMYEYIPDNLPSGRPLVVVLHGCTQTAMAMTAAGWNQLADEQSFAVVYAQQSSDNNPVQCFNWAGEYGDTANLERGKGENQSIVSMIDYAIAMHGSDSKRVYIAGFSAGGAFVAVMLATWPDRFAAGAIMSGVPYRCATSVNGAYSCQNPGVMKSPSEWGDLVRSADSFSAQRPRLQIWHGGADTIVATMNQGELVKQWTNVLGIDPTPAAMDTDGKATRAEYRDGTRKVLETYTIDGMGHAVVTGGTGCPATAGAYFTDAGICSTVKAAEFFQLMGGGDGGSDGGGSDGGSNGGGGDDGNGGGGNQDLPGCGLNASGAGSGFAMVLFGLAFAIRRRR